MRIISNRKNVALLLITVFLLIGVAYFSVQRHNNNELRFQAYTPTKLPSGIHLTDHATYVYNGEGEHFKQVSLLTNVYSFGIGEEKSTFQQFQATTFNCASKIANSTCITLSSPAGQLYDVQTIFTNRSKISDKTISWHRNNTRFWISLSNDQLQNYSDKSWGPIIDSFQPVNYGFEKGKNIHFSGG